MAKRKQVKNACVNCQRACKKCDDLRPCGRCVKYGLGETCIDSGRKERKRGVKRGPYQRTGPSEDSSPDSGKTWLPDSTDERSSILKSSDGWNTVDFYERPIRAARKRPINYYEPTIIGDTSENEDGEAEEPEEEEDTGENSQFLLKSQASGGKVTSRHSALFQMVLDVMHGDLTLPKDHPRLSELAAVCTEMIEREFNLNVKVDPFISSNFIDSSHPNFPSKPHQDHYPSYISGESPKDAMDHSYETDRKTFNVTPTLPPSHIFRQVPTPPVTPTNIKPYHRPYAGAVFAPIPFLPINQKPNFTLYSGRHFGRSS